MTGMIRKFINVNTADLKVKDGSVIMRCILNYVRVFCVSGSIEKHFAFIVFRKLAVTERTLVAVVFSCVELFRDCKQ